MIKRPLCMGAVLFLCLRFITTGGIGLNMDWFPSALEQRIKGKTQADVEGTVYRREEKPSYHLLYLKDNQVRLKNQILNESRILVYIKTTTPVAIGNRVQLLGTADVFQGARNPGNFSQKFYYGKNKIHTYVWAEDIQVINSDVYWLRENLAVLQKGWKELLVKYLGAYYGNTMSAILLGDKSELDSELKELYQVSGIGHILSISGLHMSFLGNGLYSLLRKLGLPFWASGAAGVLFLAAYTLMVGLGVSSVRALIMFAVRIGADITGRDYDMPTSLALAAAAISAWRPMYLFDAGFFLSFGALAGITFVSPCVEYCFKEKEQEENPVKRSKDSGMTKYRKKIVTRLRKDICLNVAVNITLLPIMLYFFFEFPFYSIFLNLLVIPLLSTAIGAGAAGLFIALIYHEAGGLVLLICKFMLYLSENICKFSIDLPGSRIVTGQPAKNYVIVYYCCLIIFCLVIYRCKSRETLKRKRYILSGGKINWFGCLYISPMILLLIIFSHLSYEKKGELRITMLDVGQGDGLYIKGPGGINYFVDGGSSDVSGVGSYRIEPFLKSRGVAVLDYVFISHGDGDHISGIEELLENQKMGIRIKTLVLPPKQVQDDALRRLAERALHNQTRVVIMGRGDTLTENELSFSCIAPSSSYKGEPGNAASMVLEVKYRDFNMLFTGDVEGEGERILENELMIKEYDLLKVAHHGSKNSSFEKFLELANPSISWISAGINNWYGHPHKDTVQRLEDVGSRIYCTKDDGAVSLVTDGYKAEISTYAD
jgi:competence protein ComEC